MIGLGLDYRRFHQPAKKISNNIILSSISLRRKDSADLIEKTNREGFIENEVYEAFKEAILHSLNIVETLRYKDKLKLREALWTHSEIITCDVNLRRSQKDMLKKK